MASPAVHVAIIKANVKTYHPERLEHFRPVPYALVTECDDYALNKVADWLGIARIPEQERRLT